MKNLKISMIAGAVFVSVLGTLLHFAYSSSGDNAFVVFTVFPPDIALFKSPI